ncbi:MAG: 4Fe-4S binding protein [Desulfobacter sp.]|nr:MAG: 4Fe-4S binding protein [Desulfobacter sp.]
MNTVTLVCFSPTGTTKKILNAVAEGLEAGAVDTIDLTLPEAEKRSPEQIEEGLIIIGVPVYEGRVAKTAAARLKQLRGSDTPAVAVVMYGNRDYEDALIELTDIVRDQGFLPIAGGAFVGEHSFSNEQRPMANGRPDDRDIAEARAFGSNIRAKMERLDSLNGEAVITPPGNRPYIEHDRRGMENKAASTSVQDCTLCGECEPLCPVGAITIEMEEVKTDRSACILCNACVKHCPAGARVVDDPMIDKLLNWVFKNHQDRREPEVFL